MRTALRDETWWLAAAGDAGGLRRAADLLAAAGPTYDDHRARAFALALERQVEAALQELDGGRREGWPGSRGYDLDRARVWHLAGDGRRALDALLFAARGAEHLDPAVAELAATIAAADASLRRRALRVVVSGGTTWERVRHAAGVVARRR